MYFSYFLCENGEKIDTLIELIFKDNSELDYSGLFKINNVFEEFENSSVIFFISFNL